MKGSGGIDDIDLKLKYRRLLQKLANLFTIRSYLECALCSGAWDICAKLGCDVGDGMGKGA
jgi:hypothetical protein